MVRLRTQLAYRLTGQRKGRRLTMKPPTPMTLLQAMATEEGFYADGAVQNRPQRNNNPLDLEWHPWMEQFGAAEGDPRFAIFPDEGQGFAAARHLFGFGLYKGKTISQVIPLFAPSTENDTNQYVRTVCSLTEQQPDTIIDGILG